MQGERFSTDRLDELENEISSAGERLVDREREIFLEIRNQVKAEVPLLLRAAAIIATSISFRVSLMRQLNMDMFGR